MKLIYIVIMLILMLACAAMIGKLYDHLELRENRELLILVTGLFIDFSGCMGMSFATHVSELMVAYRLMLIGRGLFGVGFILYYGRCLNAKNVRPTMCLWLLDRFLCIGSSFFYEGKNWYLTDISIKEYFDMSIFSGHKHTLYYTHVTVVFLVGFWAVSLIIREYLKIRKKGDRIQVYILIYFAMGVVLQGISLTWYEMGGFEHPDYTSILRGFMACIYSVMAMKYHFVSYESLARDTLLSDIGAGFIVLSTKYRILYFNDIAKDAFPELATLEGLSPYSATVREAIDLRESEIKRRGVTYRVTAERIYNKHKLAGYSLLIVNVTDFLLLEKQASVSRDAKEKLLTNMAHELRTPINAISGEAEMMLGCKEPDRYPEYARNIQASVDRLNDAFNYLLEAFNEETEAVVPTENPYNICVLLDTVIAECTKRAVKKEIEFSVDIDSNLYVDAVGDDANVYKLLMNVITNSIRYTESGSVLLSVSSSLKDNGQCDYEFCIADTGAHAETYRAVLGDGSKTAKDKRFSDNVGISFLLAKRLLKGLNGELRINDSGNEVNALHIKVPQKISSSNTIMSLGMSGKMKVVLLGNKKEYWSQLERDMDKLEIEHSYAVTASDMNMEGGDKALVVFTELPKDNSKKNNFEKPADAFLVYTSDTIQATDNAGESVVVSRPFSLLTLRRVFSAMDMIQGISSDSISSDFIAPSIKALVVDDEYLNRKVACQILDNFKIKSEAVSSGYECLDILKSGKRYDIIFMDYMMEGLNGIDTTIQIRAFDLEVKNTCIVAFTANDAPGAKEKYMAAGMNDILFKPAGKDDFARVLRKNINPEHILEKVHTQEEIDASSIEIEGINVEHGLKYVAGSMEAYKTILIEFGKEIYDKSAKISEFFSMGDWYDFTVYVHGVKSSSRMLGIDELGEQMASLEVAGKTEDAEFVEANLTKVLDFYESFVPLIGALDTTEEDTREHSSLYKLILEIKSAIEDFELEDAENLLKELASGNYGEIDEYDMIQINESLKAQDYYELADHVDRLLEKVAAKENNS